MSRISKDTLPAIWTFIQVVEAGSLTGAARELGVTPSGVSKQLSGLEKKLGVRLLHRTTRRIRPTDEGQSLYQRCRPLFEAFDEAGEAVRNMRDSLSGSIRIAATPAFGRAFLAPAVGAFVERYPGVSVEMAFSAHRVDLIEEGIDLALREGVLPDSNLVGVRLGEVRIVLCASPEYLARRSAPKDLASLEDHETISVPQPGFGGALRSIEDSIGGRLRLKPRILVNDLFSIRELVLAGLGVGPLPDYMVRRELAEGELVQVLPDAPLPTTLITALYPEKQFQSLRVKTLVGYLAERFREENRVVRSSTD